MPQVLASLPRRVPFKGTVCTFEQRNATKDGPCYFRTVLFQDRAILLSCKADFHTYHTARQMTMDDISAKELVQIGPESPQMTNGILVMTRLTVDLVRMAYH